MAALSTFENLLMKVDATRATEEAWNTSGLLGAIPRLQGYVDSQRANAANEKEKAVFAEFYSLVDQIRAPGAAPRKFTLCVFLCSMAYLAYDMRYFSEHSDNVPKIVERLRDTQFDQNSTTDAREDCWRVAKSLAFCYYVNIADPAKMIDSVKKAFNLAFDCNKSGLKALIAEVVQNATDEALIPTASSSSSVLIWTVAFAITISFVGLICYFMYFRKTGTDTETARFYEMPRFRATGYDNSESFRFTRDG